MSKDFLFTSESVAEGHPDKIADQISDAVLDAIIKDDPKARVACEVFIKTGMVLIAGEVSTTTWVELETLTRNTINNIGFTNSNMGFDGHSCAVLNAIGKQSSDISLGVTETPTHEQGAGDQGMMFGYATIETPTLMPAPIHLAHALVQQQSRVRRMNILPWLRPDAKSQVTLRYENYHPVGIESVVLSTQHAPEIDHATLEEAVIETIIKPVLPEKWIKNHIKYWVNPTGRFVIGGPMGDTGLTGRKIIVDTYGGMARHGGGAFSGKDPSKVDRSASYMARYVAKNLVKAGLAERLELNVAYAIGVASPLVISVETFGTGRLPDEEICKIVKELFDFRPGLIIKMLDLLRPIYAKTAVFGHFGREEPEFTWEKTDKVDIIRDRAGLKFHDKTGKT